VNLPREILARNDVRRAVVFSPTPFAPRTAKCSASTTHFVNWRPNNDPKLNNPILWVNHVTVEEDRALLALFPDRPGIVFFYDERCAATMIPLNSPAAAAIPAGNIDGTRPPPGLRLEQEQSR
jgi:hypothetical protein